MVAELGATICLVWGSAVILVSSLGYFQLWRHYSTRNARSPHETEDAPHITIIRPVKGLDPGLYDCLVSTFRQTYPNDRLTVHFCLDSRDDLALPVLERLLEDFPKADARLFIEEADPALLANNGTALGPNPKIRSMSRAYREANGDIIWIVDCNVWVAKGVCGRMVDTLLGKGEGTKPQKLVHQIPLVVDTDILSAPETHHLLNANHSDVQIASTSTRATETRNLHNSSTYATKGGRLEEMFMSTAHAKFYTAINTVLIAPCLVGKSNMFRRSHLNALTDNKGIDYFSHNICEDHLIGDLLWKQAVPATLTGGKTRQWGNHALVFGDLAVQPMAHMGVGEYVARRVRWLRVRKYTVPAATAVEPTTESFLCSLMLSYGLTSHSFIRSTFGIPQTWTAFAICWLLSVSAWAFIDWTLYQRLHSAVSIEVDENTPDFARAAGKGGDKRPLTEWVAAWIGREALAFPVWFWAIFGGATVTWRGKKFWVDIGMVVHEIDTHER
ncbi:ATP-dependent DNA helicase [Venturia nashicola]|nr:ATP-dependent DNA helicase [Venturia nashicola]